MSAISVVSNPVRLTVTNNAIELSIVPETIEVVFNTGNVTITGTASQVNVTAPEALSGHRVVTVEGYYASNTTATDKFKILGLTTGAVISGDSATVQTFGELTYSGWNWTLGNPVFLTTNGNITQTVPTSGYRIIIGKPITATILFIEISEPFILA